MWHTPEKPIVLRRPFPEFRAVRARPMMPQTLIGSSELGTAIFRLMSGDVFTALAVEEREQRAVGLETILQAVVDVGTRVIWVGNPLRSPLTIERFLLQIVGPEVDLRIERSPAELARLIARPEGAESRLLVIVQQPETINPETIEQLGAMAGHLGSEVVQLQFLFVGSPTLRLPDVALAELGPISRPNVEVAKYVSVAPPVSEFEAGDWTVGAVPRRWTFLPWLCGLLGLFLCGVFVLAATTQQTAPSPRATPTETGRLHQHFDVFLSERVAALPPLTDAQKNALFEDFLKHQHRE